MQLLRLLCTERGGELYFLVTSSLDRILMISSSLAWSCSSRCLRASSVLDLQALAWSTRSFSPALSAFSLWIYIYIYIPWIYIQLVDIIHLFLNVLPFTSRYRLWYTWWSVFLDSWYLLSSQRSSHPLLPGYLFAHLSTGSTLSLIYAHMPALPASQGVFPPLSPRSHRLPGDQLIFDWLPDLLMGIGLGDFISLLGVQPDRFATAGVPWRQASSAAWAYSWLWPQQWKEKEFS